MSGKAKLPVQFLVACDDFGIIIFVYTVMR